MKELQEKFGELIELLEDSGGLFEPEAKAELRHITNRIEEFYYEHILKDEQ